ncbi:MAG: DUF1801 domain-containing protein [Rhizobiaceae bacterium]
MDAAERVRPKQRPIADPAVRAVFDTYPEPAGQRLRRLRDLILDTAAATEGVGRVEERLKWGQPSYLTPESGSGSTIRIDAVRGDASAYAVYFHCQTDLVATFRRLYPDALDFEGNRAIRLRVDDDLPGAELAHCIALALTYHLRKKRVAP